MIFSEEHLKGFKECPHFKGKKPAIEDVRVVSMIKIY